MYFYQYEKLGAPCAHFNKYFGTPYHKIDSLRVLLAHFGLANFPAPSLSFRQGLTAKVFIDRTLVEKTYPQRGLIRTLQ